MTKPQFAPEPSMEDILASIRKMISEDRLGPRPVPDQIARTSIGERAAPSQPAKTDTRPEPQQPSLATPPPPKPYERPVPSFSSLSDALKSAAAAPSGRRSSLDDKLAHMLDAEKAPAAESQTPAATTLTPVTPLAVFAANRPASPTPGPTEPPAELKPAAQGRAAPRGLSLPERTASPATSLRPTPVKPLAEASGASPSPSHGHVLPGLGSPAAAGAGADATQTSLPKAPQAKAPGEPAAASPVASETEARAADPHDGDARDNTDQTIILMPARFSGAPAVPHIGSATNGSALNGVQASVIGLRQQPDAAPHADERPSDRAAETQEFSAESASDAPATAEALELPADPYLLFKLEPVLPELAQDEEEASTYGLDQPVDAAADSPADTLAPSVLASAAMFAGSSRAEPASDASAVTDAGGPSESLIDAVMEMVHAEPEALSVLTSGANFIHGTSKRSPSQAASPDQPAAAPKLDGAAAELLRPMLRQWLADNMPRIVEEALRSELMSTQGAGAHGSGAHGSGAQGSSQGPKKS